MTTKEAQNALANLKRYMSGGGVVDRSTNKAIDMAIKALEKSERKKGKWVTHKEPHKNMCYYIKCSKCGKEAIWTNGFSLYPPNFCPNCGVYMKEGETDESD